MKRRIDPASISFETLPVVLPSPSRFEPRDYIRSYRLKIVYWTGNRDIKIGEATASILQTLQADSDRESMFEVCDCHSQDFYLLHTAIYRKKEGILRQEFGDLAFDYREILFIECITLKPEYRGQKIGGLIARGICEVIGGGAALPVLQAHPTFEKEQREKFTPKEIKAIQKKLITLYKDVGFTLLPRTDGYMFLPVDEMIPNYSEEVAAWKVRMGLPVRW